MKGGIMKPFDKTGGTGNPNANSDNTPKGGNQGNFNNPQYNKQQPRPTTNTNTGKPNTNNPGGTTGGMGKNTGMGGGGTGSGWAGNKKEQQK